MIGTVLMSRPSIGAVRPETIVPSVSSGIPTIDGHYILRESLIQTVPVVVQYSRNFPLLS
jgi:hypothetical protein